MVQNQQPTFHQIPARASRRTHVSAHARYDIIFGHCQTIHPIQMHLFVFSDTIQRQTHDTEKQMTSRNFLPTIQTTPKLLFWESLHHDMIPLCHNLPGNTSHHKTHSDTIKKARSNGAQFKLPHKTIFLICPSTLSNSQALGNPS